MGVPASVPARLAAQPRLGRGRFGGCSIVYCDYPERWPQLLQQIQANLGSQVGAGGVSLLHAAGHCGGGVLLPPPLRC
jgi:hypothetical protein